MTMTTRAKNVFAVWWKDMNRWSVNSFHASSWRWPAEHIKKLNTALERKCERVDKSTFKLGPEHFIRLRFSGQVEQRDLKGKTKFTGDLFFARAGDLIYSKIDVRNGAIGIVPKEFPVITVTSEFPVYSIRKDIAIPEYVQLVFRSEHFRRIINGMVSGTSGRKRVQPHDLENLQIPLPPQPQQREIVARWQKAQAEISAVHARIIKLKASLDNQFFNELDLKIPRRTKLARALAVEWKNFLRWGVEFNQLNQINSDLTRGKYQVAVLDSLLQWVQYGTSEKANTDLLGVPIIRMNNIVDGELELSNLKSVQLSDEEVKRLLLRTGDILFNRTNSKELVGKCAVFHGEGDYVFASYIIRMRTDSNKADPDFLAYVINSPIGRQQIDAMSRQIIGQANVNSMELRGFRVPLPPLNVQKEIMHRVSRGRMAIARERDCAKRIETTISEEIDALILGTEQL